MEESLLNFLIATSARLHVTFNIQQCCQNLFMLPWIETATSDLQPSGSTMDLEVAQKSMSHHGHKAKWTELKKEKSCSKIKATYHDTGCHGWMLLL